MNLPIERVDAALMNVNADGYLLDADSSNGDQRYLSGLNGHDPFITLYTPGTVHLLIGGTDYTRAKAESNATDVARLAAYDYETKQKEDPKMAKSDALSAFLGERNIESVLVPDRFPHGTARGLRSNEIDVIIDDDDTLETVRAVKTREEVAAIESAQQATEAAMKRAETLLAEADVADGVLMRDEQPLTGKSVKSEIEVTLLEHGAALHDTLVSCGEDAANPHGKTSGPLRPNESIVIDIFPKDLETGYHSDMTRTFVKGAPSDQLQTLYDEVYEALEIALETVQAGVTGDEVNDRVFTFFEENGHQSRRKDTDIEAGALHYIGHGVGLDVHELPVCLPGGKELEAGNVITLEPGLYYPDIGGVRIEDVIEITENGYRPMTDYHKQFVID
ncbi:M24 family metallopeptidase [Natronosalvus halobius]|uniref:M24 family metallopeptidase n=1 Tax=Natronosalvus halobius TaxID=2953746 RepID=UPI00209F98A1|nr:Xaa-Pro peptidase family protein [Natronosalvus halobius]USZ73680.1 Xaa-Pro peptidase family protein [Natronosalvus halobius]